MVHDLAPRNGERDATAIEMGEDNAGKAREGLGERQGDGRQEVAG